MVTCCYDNDVRHMVRLAAELREPGWTAAQKAQRLAAGVVTLLHVNCCSVGKLGHDYGRSEVTVPDVSRVFRGMGCAGDLSAEGLATILDAWRDPTMRDPGLVEIARSSRSGASLTRPQLVDDRQWFGSAAYQHLLRHHNLHDKLYGIVEISDPDWTGIICVTRPAGAAPFGDRERWLMDLVRQELAPLVFETEAAQSRANTPEQAAWQALSRTQSVMVPMLMAGLTEQEIAERMHRSRHTVHDHVKRIYAALGVHSRVELVRRYGLIAESSRGTPAYMAQTPLG